MALGNPIEAFLQAAREKKDNQQQMFQNIAGMGQGIGQMGQSIGEMVAQERKKKMLQQLVSAIRNQGAPQQGPQLPGVGAAGTPSPMSGMGAPPQNNSSQIMSIMAQLDPQGTIKSMMPPDPFKQSQIDLNRARTAKLQQPPGLPPSKPTVQQDLRQKFIDAINKRTDVQARSLNARQINNLAKTTGLQPTLVKQLQVNNVRADRALAILNDPKATWTALNGWVSTDFAGMMQGGAPQKDQILESQFPNWRAKVAQIQTFMGTQPAGPIPDGFRDYMKHFVRGVKEIDNDYLWKNAEFQGQMIGPTIQGGKPFVKKSLDFTKGFMKGGVSTSPNQSTEDPLGIR